MKRILFVDDEPNILEGLQRMLFPLQREWHMAFASDGPHALEIMKEQRFDVVVTDMRMPGMDGAALLAEVRKRHPDTVRFVLTGQSDSETVYRSIGEAHQFLTKPCKPSVLKEAVDRALSIRDLLASDALKSMVSQIGNLPPMPQTYTQLREKLQSADTSAAELGRIIEQDVAMTAKVLQLVNSAFFGLRQHVSTATQAVALLGVETIKALVLTTGLFGGAEKTRFPAEFSFDRLWRHSLAVGSYAQAIARAEKAPKELVNDAYTAGLLHDAGELVIAASCPEGYSSAYAHAVGKKVPLAEAEKELLGCSHAEIGAYLLGIWGLPHPIVEAVAYHQRPSRCVATAFSPLTAVHIADALAWKGRGGEVAYPVGRVDRAFLQGLGMEGRVKDWDAACAALNPEEDEQHE